MISKKTIYDIGTKIIQSASAHSAGPLCFFVGLWLVGLWFVGLWPSIVLKNALAEIDAKFHRKLANICKFVLKCEKKGRT